MARECAGPPTTAARRCPSFRSCWTMFDSRAPTEGWSGLLKLGKCPAGVMDSMTDFESVGRGSTPRRGTEWSRAKSGESRARCNHVFLALDPRLSTLDHFRPRVVPDSHASPRSSRTRFDSWRGRYSKTLERGSPADRGITCLLRAG